MTPDAIAVTFSPLVPWAVIIALGALAILAVLPGWLKRAPGAFWRTAALATLDAGATR